MSTTGSDDPTPQPDHAASAQPDQVSTRAQAPMRPGFNRRFTGRHLAHASLFATIGALVAVIIPGFSNAMQTPSRVQKTSLALMLPDVDGHADKGTGSGDNWHTVQLKKGQTLGAVFNELGIPQSQLVRVAQNPKIKPELRRMRPGDELSFNLPSDGSVRAMRMAIDGETTELEFSPDAVREKEITHEVTRRTVVLSGKIGRSLTASARKAGLGNKQIAQLTDEMFKYDIDFDSDLGPEDRFSAVVEQTWRDGQLADTGPVLAATVTMGDKLHSAFRFVRDGKPEYFTSDGRSLKRPFIRMPIPYARVSSGFGMRKHPVLGRMRGHMGIDYAAGTGTPIMAAGDARVEFAGWKGGYGRAVILDHGQGRTTLYGHMSSIGKIKVGQRIAQGTMIGRVGSTGMSTGPHLHYEFRINGVHRNPLSMTLPPPQPLTGAPLVAFRDQTRVALRKIREVENVIYPDLPDNDDAPRVAQVEKKKPDPRKG